MHLYAALWPFDPVLRNRCWQRWVAIARFTADWVCTTPHRTPPTMNPSSASRWRLHTVWHRMLYGPEGLALLLAPTELDVMVMNKVPNKGGGHVSIRQNKSRKPPSKRSQPGAYSPDESSRPFLHYCVVWLQFVKSSCQWLMGDQIEISCIEPCQWPTNNSATGAGLHTERDVLNGYARLLSCMSRTLYLHRAQSNLRGWGRSPLWGPERDMFGGTISFD